MTFRSLWQILLSTCHGAGSRQLNNMNFDVCIIDEVSISTSWSLHLI